MNKKNLFYQITFIFIFTCNIHSVFPSENTHYRSEKYAIGIGEIIKSNNRISDVSNGKGEDIKLNTIPLIKVRFGPLQIGESGLTFSFLGDRERAIYLNLNRNSDGFQYQGLRKKRNSWLFGLGAKYKSFTLLCSRDIDGNSKGKKINLNYLKIFSLNDDTTLISTFGLSYFDQKYSDYYYGVTTEEATLVNITKYQTTGYLLPYIGIIPSYRFNQYSLFTANTFKFLPKEIRKSPTMKNYFIDYTFLLGFFWHF